LIAKPETVLLSVADCVAGETVHGLTGRTGTDCAVDDPPLELLDGGAAAEIVKVTSLVLFR
jgi:hypothetical protein